ncbi:GTPase-activating protein [Trichlorobacter lovleyi]|uniref:GTPase-activating protein n=1 Tax=Trichlorobacter lovleyi TaxID=313985 RepID=UPI00223F7020|nr:GTPase-activating protein [Trichlorobacter lovleyi]QOX78803.1 GTPase-activating protein [Trichlorobacter lovleyi]
MFLLPKGNPLAENVPISKLQLPEALEKLKNGKLTGCAMFDFPAADCALVYDEGKLVTAIVHRENKEIKEQAALQALVELMLLASSGTFSVYALSKDITLAVMALAGGQATIDSQEIKLIDFKALLDRIKTEQMTATLKIYTPERAGLIFYRSGATVGFFHDASSAIETSAGEVQQIAGLPGARVDLRVLAENDGFVLDLAGLVDIRSLWEASSGNIFATTPVSSTPVSEPAAIASKITAADLETAIIDLANQYIGKLGRTLAEKELMNIGGASTLTDPDKLQELLAAIEKGSKMLASANKIKEMKEAISNQAAQL